MNLPRVPPDAVPVAPGSHVLGWVRTSGGAHVFLFWHCTICRDVTQKACAQPRERGPRWTAVYLHLHPAAAHHRQ